MGIETDAELGGSEQSFTAALIAIEELAKVEPGVSAMVDIHVSYNYISSPRVVHYTR
jgi:short/branched chain acyl-CoA dehydrogenase